MQQSTLPTASSETEGSAKPAERLCRRGCGQPRIPLPAWSGSFMKSAPTTVLSPVSAGEPGVRGLGQRRTRRLDFLIWKEEHQAHCVA